MNDGEYLTLQALHAMEITGLRNLLRQAQLRHSEATSALVKRCLEEHGAHNDNGGFLHGFCTRCGAFLG